ncbi:hypothetical protein BOO88_24305 [Stutzerimonas stutzeri]|nr:hypothetical protein BOO88_24305 [Stutzerimonas stutzeri]
MLAELNEGVRGFHAFNPNLGGKDGKQSKKIERNTRGLAFIEILLLQMVAMILFFARGLSSAQLSDAGFRGGSLEGSGDWNAAFAGKPAPTGTEQSLWERACPRRGHQPRRRFRAETPQ